MATKASDGGGDSKALAGDARCAFAELRPAGGGTAGHGYFCGVLAARGAIEGREEAEVDSLDRDGRGAIDVSGVAGFRNHGDEPQRDFFRADAGGHHGVAAGAGAEFSGLGARAGPITMGDAEDLGTAA